MTSTKSLVPLQCKIMNYAWGKVGENSLVYQFAFHNYDGKLDTNIPYAEFWMGDHPNAPSLSADNKKKISDILREAGKDEQLQFLFKICCIKKIQSTILMQITSQKWDFS